MSTITIVIISSVSSTELAETMAQRLVEEQLAAKVRIINSESHSLRDGSLQHEIEYTLRIETTQAKEEATVNFIKEMHPDSMPEIITVPVVGGLPEYLDWIKNEVQ